MMLLKDFDVKGKRILYLADLNIPQNDQNQIIDDYKLKLLCPTVTYLMEQEAKVIILGHSSSPNSRPSFNKVATRLSELLKKQILFSGDFSFDSISQTVEKMSNGQVLMIENLLRCPEYESSGSEFVKQFRKVGDLLVSDNLAESGQKHAAIITLPTLFHDKMAGLLLQKEIDYFHRTFLEPKKPLCLVLGGSRLATKFELLSRFAACAEKIIIGGAIANTFLAAQGLQMGRSLQEPEYFQKVLALLVQMARKDCKVYLPVDFLVGPSTTVRGLARAVPVQEVPADTQALDIGPATNVLFKEALQNAETIFWNGAMGIYENDDYENGTCEMVNSLASSHAITVAAGTDTVAAIRKMELEHKFSHISSGSEIFLDLIKGRRPTGLQTLGLI